MSILRNKLKENFSQLPNSLITDARISSGAFRVAAYLFSRPDGWDINNIGIQSSLDIKDRDTLARYWHELMDAGWIGRQRKQDESGKLLGGFDYEIMPEGGNLPKEEKNRMRENTVNGKNPPLTNTYISSNTKKDKNNTKERQTSNLDFSAFDIPETAAEVWKEWVAFKKTQFKFQYKHDKYEQQAVNDLRGKSGGSVDVALHIVQNSILSGWRGLFGLKGGAPQTESEASEIEGVAQLFKATWHTPNPETVKELSPKIRKLFQSGETLDAFKRNIELSRKVASVWGNFTFLVENYPKLKSICDRNFQAA